MRSIRKKIIPVAVFVKLKYPSSQGKQAVTIPKHWEFFQVYFYKFLTKIQKIFLKIISAILLLTINIIISENLIKNIPKN